PEESERQTGTGEHEHVDTERVVDPRPCPGETSGQVHGPLPSQEPDPPPTVHPEPNRDPGRDRQPHRCRGDPRRGPLHKALHRAPPLTPLVSARCDCCGNGAYGDTRIATRSQGG